MLACEFLKNVENILRKRDFMTRLGTRLTTSLMTSLMTRLLVFSALFLLSFVKNATCAETPVMESFVQAGDAQLFCSTLGQGKPLIVLHGGPGLSQDYLQPHLEELGKHHFVIFYDQRGSGKSTGEINPEDMNLETFIEDLDQVRKTYNLETVSILGHSWGGFVGLNYALKYPERVEKLILSNSMPASSDGLALFHAEWVRRNAPFIEELMKIRNDPAFIAGDPELTEHYYRVLFRVYCHCPESANFLNLKMSANANTNAVKIFGLMTKNVLCKPYNLHPLLSTLEVPTLIIHGQDDIVPSSTAQATCECLPNATLILIEDCGHFPYVEAPETYFCSLKDFLT